MPRIVLTAAVLLILGILLIALFPSGEPAPSPSSPMGSAGTSEPEPATASEESTSVEDSANKIVEKTTEPSEPAIFRVFVRDDVSGDQTEKRQRHCNHMEREKAV